MHKKFIGLMMLMALAFMAFPASAAQKGSYTLPKGAVEVAPGIYKLADKYDAETDSFLEGYAFVHKKANARSGNAKPTKPTTCYGFIGSGAKWKVVPEGWQVNGANINLDPIFVRDTLTASIAKWEVAAGVDILGNGGLVIGFPADPDYNETNEVVFKPVQDSNTIAVTTVWGRFSGPTFAREIVEWDQVYNTNYSWSASGEAGKMDFENIATHELGHAIGMGDIYTASCSAVTMYGYADNGETNKRTLEAADIAGINALY